MANSPAQPLLGKAALVTGGSSGIGRAAALALAQAGADVAVNYFTLEESAQELAREVTALGRRVLLLPVDISDQAAVDGMVERAARDLGRLDLLVSAAAYSDRELFHLADLAGFRRTVDVTMWGAFYVLRAVANVLIRQGQGGAVVVVGSGHAHTPLPSCMAYNMAKAANEQMARTAAIELARHRIRVNLVHPGWTDTPGERKFFSEEALRQGSGQLPWGRLARPEEVARVILFLLDPASDYITGATYAVDGGASLPWWSKRGTGAF